MSQEENFLSHVSKSEGCWEWTGCIQNNGYGKYTRYDSMTKKFASTGAHRMAYKLFVGDPGDLYVCHRCDNKRCVRPDHLFLGTHSENMVDSIKKKRHQHTKKTHCPQGHPYEGTNLRIEKTPTGGGRKCRKCHNIRSMQRYYRNKERDSAHG